MSPTRPRASGPTRATRPCWLNVVSRFSYTLETLIQAGKSDITVTSVPIRTNPKSRESRLFKSTFQYIKRSVGTIFQIWTMYGPLPAFLWPALVFALGGSVLVGRFLWHYFESAGPTGHVQSLVLGAALLIVAFLLVMLGIISDLLRANRILTERALHRIRHIELALDVPPEKSLEESRRRRARLHRRAPRFSAAPRRAENQRFLPPCFARYAALRQLSGSFSR